MRRTVYIAGSVGKSSRQWRRALNRIFLSAGIEPLDPTRGGNFSSTVSGKRTDAVAAALFVPRDIQDVLRADAVLVVHWLASEVDQKVGTWAEFGIAHLLRRPVVVVTDDPDVAAHPFIKQWATTVRSTLEEGAKDVIWLLR